MAMDRSALDARIEKLESVRRIGFFALLFSLVLLGVNHFWAGDEQGVGAAITKLTTFSCGAVFIGAASLVVRVQLELKRLLQERRNLHREV